MEQAPAGKPDAADKGFDTPQWDSVDDWPQVSGHLRATLDADLISRHAVAVLRRSLDFKRVIGFIGSGVSMSYGRLGWGELVRWLAQSVGDKKESQRDWQLAGQGPLNALRAAKSQPGKSAPTPTQSRMKDLLDRLDIQARERSPDIQSGRLPAAFQFLEQYARECDPEDGSRADSAMRGMVRALLRDDAGQAYLLLERMLSEVAQHEPLCKKQFKRKRAAPSLHALSERWKLLCKELSDASNPDSACWHRFRRQRPAALPSVASVKGDWRQLFDVTPEHLIRFGETLPQPSIGRELCTAVAQALATPGAARCAGLAPLHRFVVPALMRLDPLRACEALLPAWDTEPSRIRSARAERIAEGRDPLLKLMREFGIERLATTNYDLDIEQAMFDLGFDHAGPGSRATAGSPGLTRNALGVPAHDAVLRHDQAADLLRFANAGAVGMEVIHLHGRVLPGEPLVITEGDYQAMYLQRNGTAEAAAAAIELAMRSNTVLFLGSGMGEDDILRPMRQFVTERRSSADRSGVVLLPADGTPAREVEDAIALYSRYGVLTKHFGLGEGARGEKVRWLADALKCCDDVDDAIRKRLKAIANARQWPPDDEDVAFAEQQAPETINGRPVDDLVRSLGLGGSWSCTVEMALLAAVVKSGTALCINLPPPQAQWAAGDDPAQAWQRNARCLRALLDGLRGALRALAMMLELASLHQGWLDWKLERTKAPRLRPVGAQRQRMTGNLEAGRAMHVFTRNRLALAAPLGEADEPPRPLPQVPATDRFHQGAPSHSFSRFAAALRSAAVEAPTAWRPSGDEAHGRRIFMLLSTRGLGKGHLFEMMAEGRRVDEFISSSWRCEAGESAPAYAVACYVNLGVSLEFLSAFDRLSAALLEMAPVIFPPSATEESSLKKSLDAANHRLRHNRLARLQFLLAHYARHARRARGRVLLAINGFSQLFDRHGAPKNAQLHRLIDALFGPAAAAVPIDLITLCPEDEIPGPFRRDGVQTPIRSNALLDEWKGTRYGPLAHIAEPHIEERHRRRIEQTLATLNMAEGMDRVHAKAWVHVLRGARASATVGKYFPEVALSVALGSGSAARKIIATPVDVRSLQNAIAGAFRKDSESPGAPPAAGIDKATLFLLADLVDAATGNAAGEWRLVDWLQQDGAQPEQALRSKVQQARLAQDPSPTAREIDARFGDLHHGVRAYRYLLTIACAAASERGWRREGTASAWTFDTAAVQGWLETLRLLASNHLREDAADLVITQVLQSHQQGHEQRRLPPFFALGEGGCTPPAVEELFAALHRAFPDVIPAPGHPMAPEAVPEALYGPLAWRLQQRLLWHTAVTVLGVQDDVLATAPLVEQDCILLLTELANGASTAVSPQMLRQHDLGIRLVRVMMDLLVQRCLVFRVEPVQLNPLDTAEPQAVHTGWRFSIHRFLQRTILEQLESPFVEFPRVDQFGLSMWATQPDELPRPHRSAAHDIADLVAAWVGFPKNGEALRSVSVFDWFLDRARQAARRLDAATARDVPEHQADWRALTLPARMLRAAFGVLRATYSVAVVSHFHDFDDDGGGLRAPADGYFKQHHLQVRWLLEQAKKLGQPKDKWEHLLQAVQRGGEQDPGRGLVQEAVAPFFADELVWLNNECGLFCLVEGRLQNAAGMFRQALLAAEEVEGRERHGALWCRIGLNLAVVDIDAGRTREAEDRLRAIAGVNDENPILRVLARGFLALVQHMAGQLDHAATVYSEVIDDLVALGQLRSVAIFSRHLGDLRRLQGRGSAQEAWNAIEQSISAATRGGHEDIRHLALLSRVRLAISGHLPDAVRERERATIQANLDGIERYGHAMGMPRLLAEVAFARALYLLELGDTRHAALLAYRCLGLCNAHGLRLRHMMGTALLGRIYKRRGLDMLADPLLVQADALAAEFHYGNLRETGGGAGAMPPAGL